MSKRYAAIWFRHLLTDRMIRRQADLTDKAFVLAAPEHGRMVIRAASKMAEAKGIYAGMVVADCRAILPLLPVLDYQAGTEVQLLTALAEWCIRFTPIVAPDPPDGLILDTSGCTHLWGGEAAYLKDLLGRLRGFGYDVRGAMASTIGMAWANARYGRIKPIIAPGEQLEALLPMPPAALRMEPPTIERLSKLGLSAIRDIVFMPRRALLRRFGTPLMRRLDQALGQEAEAVQPVTHLQPYIERLHCPELIRTAPGIAMALRRLLDTLCATLEKEGKGIRTCVLAAYRVDNEVQQISIGTTRATRNTEHLFRLFDIRLATLRPALGFELFTLHATSVDDVATVQEALWGSNNDEDAVLIAELLDRLSGKISDTAIRRFLPAAHHWPERSYSIAASLLQPGAEWLPTPLPRPVQLLPEPEPITVSVALPDYPPMLFIHKGIRHTLKKAEGPERIEQEWWLSGGLPRDYYCTEDELGQRHWIFRSGHYHDGEPQWFLHGMFA